MWCAITREHWHRKNLQVSTPLFYSILFMLKASGVLLANAIREVTSPIYRTHSYMEALGYAKLSGISRWHVTQC